MTRIPTLATLVATFSLLAACGPGNSFNGTVEGKTFKPQSASIVLTSEPGPNQTYGVFLSDRKSPCPKTAEESTTLKGLLFLLGAGDGKGSGAPVKPGSYPLLGEDTDTSKPFNVATAVRYLELTPEKLVQYEARKGAVKLDAIEAKKDGITAGSFDFTWDNGHTTGTFLATYCESPT